MSVKYYKDGTLSGISGYKIWSGGGGDYSKVECTAAEYEAMAAHDSDTIYVVTYPDGSVKQFLGDEEIGGEGKYHEVECTKAEYDSMAAHDSDTIYIVTNPDSTVTRYLGDDEIGGSSEPDKYYTIERAAIISEEDAETMVVEQEIIDVDVVSGTTAIYGNASNKFIASGRRVIMASTDEQMANLLSREDIYGVGTLFQSATTTSTDRFLLESITISNIQLVTNTDGIIVKRYSIGIYFNKFFDTYTLDIPKENVLRIFGIAGKVSTISQTNKWCIVHFGLAGIDNEGNKYFITFNNNDLKVKMTDNELNFALGMTERYEVVES